MLFDAEMKSKKYNLSVNESRSHWKIGIRELDGDWIFYELPKDDYQYLDQDISLIFKNSSYLVDVVKEGTNFTVYSRGSFRSIKIYNEEELVHQSLRTGGVMGSGDNLVSGMPGKISKIFVQLGQEVKADEPLLIMEAMKMENEMRAPMDSTVKQIHVKEGDNVDRGTLLISFQKS